MKKIFTLLFTFSVMAVLQLTASENVVGWDFVENFSNSNLTSSYADDSFVGTNSITWTYVASRDENGDKNGSGIDGKACMLRRVSSSSSIKSSSISNGIGTFEVKLYKGFTGGGNRQVELFVNDVSQGLSTEFDDFDQHVFRVENIDVSGDIVIEIKNVTAKQIIIDDISWTSFGGVSNKVATPTIAPASGFYQTAQTVSIASTTDGASIYYTTDGTDPDITSNMYSAPFEVSTSSTVKAIATKAGMDNSSIASAQYQFGEAVADIAALRAKGTGDAIYVLTGEAVITYQQSYRGNKFIQDATAGILIDDYAGKITTSYNVYDGITGVAGTLGEYNGMLQFVPVADPGAATSTANSIKIDTVTMDDLTSNFEMYESKVVRIVKAKFTVANGDTSFINGKAYEISDDAKMGGFRTTFYDVDYIGEVIPSAYYNITGIFNSRGIESTDNYISARNSMDLEVWTSGTEVGMPSFDPAEGLVTETQNVSITSETEGAAIYYTLDGTDPDMNATMYSSPIEISASTTLKAIAYKEGYDPSVIATAVYTFPTVVADIAALRAKTEGTDEVFFISGEVILTYQQSFRGQKYIQDASGAILIDDASTKVTSTYNLMDGITGFAGKLGEYGGMLQLLPVSDPGAATSSGNTISIATVTMDDLNTNFDMYEGQVVTIKDVQFTAANGDTTFTNGKVYNIKSGNKLGKFRTTFYDMDYIGSVIGSDVYNLTGIFNSRSDGNYISARSLTDFEVTTAVDHILALNGKVFANNHSVVIEMNELSSNANAVIYDLSGKRVWSGALVSSQTIVPVQTKGIYLVTVQVNGKPVPTKVLVK